MNLEKALALKTKQDSHYQSLLQQAREKESAFLSLRSTLTQSQQEILDGYISACEELDHCLIQLAYDLGREERGTLRLIK